MLKAFILFFLITLIPLSSNGTSLWLKSSNNQRGMFGGKRAFSIGDLVTIDVAESSSLAASQNSVRNRQLEVENAVTQFLYANSGFGKHKGGLPGTQIETQSSNQGGGSIANTQDLKGRVSVIVIDVLPNGGTCYRRCKNGNFFWRKLLCRSERNGQARGYWFWF